MTIGRRLGQQGDGTDAGVSTLDKHVCQRYGRTSDYRRCRDVKNSFLRGEVRLVGDTEATGMGSARLG